MRNRRRRQFVHRRIQLALAMHSFRQWVLFLFAVFGLLCVLEYFNSGGQESLGAGAFKMWGRYGPALVVLVFLLPSMIYDSIKTSNRFVGPLLRLRSAMLSVAQNQPVEPLKCRRRDCAEDFFTAFNELLKRVKELEEQKRDTLPATEQSDDALATVP